MVGRLTAGIDLGRHRPHFAARRDADGREHAIRPDALPLELLDPGQTVLRQHGFRQRAGRQAAVRLDLVVAGHQEADDGVFAASLPRQLQHRIGDVGDVGGDRRVDARDPLLEMELVVGAEKPELVTEDRAAQLDVRFPERQVRVAREAARARRLVHVVRHPPADRLEGQVLEPREAVAAALEVLHVGCAGRAGLDVAADRRHRDFADRVEVGIEERAGIAFRRIDPLEHHLRLAADAEGVVARSAGSCASRRRRTPASGRRASARDCPTGRWSSARRRAPRR